MQRTFCTHLMYYSAGPYAALPFSSLLIYDVFRYACQLGLYVHGPFSWCHFKLLLFCVFTYYSTCILVQVWCVATAWLWSCTHNTGSPCERDICYRARSYISFWQYLFWSQGLSLLSFKKSKFVKSWTIHVYVVFKWTIFAISWQPENAQWSLSVYVEI